MTRPLTYGTSASPRRPRAVPPDFAKALHRDGFTLGHWRVEPRRNRIVADDADKTVDPRLIDLIVCLASRPGEVVGKDELLEIVWQGVSVTDNTLSQAISRLRKALVDSHQEPSYIETISKSGYRLVAEVRWLGEDAAPRPVVDMPADHAHGTETRDEPHSANSANTVNPVSPTSWTLRPIGLLAITAALLVAAGLAWMTLRFSGTPATPMSSLPAPEVFPESTLIGNQFEPSISPDGERLVFAWLGHDRSGWDIWIQQVGGDGPVRLTDDAASERAPA